MSARDVTPWLDAARRLADELAPGAAERDRIGGLPVQEVAALRASGLLAFLNPVEYGGAGGGHAQSQTLVRILARADSNAAQILAYHYLLSHNAFLRAHPAQREQLQRQSVAQRWLWGGASNPRDPALVLTPDAADAGQGGGQGFRLNGHKNFASNAAVAERIVSTARLGEVQVLLTIPGEAQGITHGDDWTAFGQRRGVSGSIRFEHVRLERDAVLGLLPGASPAPPTNPLLSLSVPLHQLYFVNLYLGNAEGALRQARHYVLESARPWQTSGVARAADDPYVLEHYGLLDADVQAAAALADRAALDWESAWRQGEGLTPAARDAAAARIYAAKVNSTRTALAATSQIFELLGARATAAHHGFDRYWRNVRTHSLHDPLAYKAREVANHALNGRITSDPLYA
ncbi:acyl-CoA dehydrogenase family protein [Hylemonella gracilis]|uniref:Putative FMNH2-dependent monooxygenase n=1 Tax=Hylemonella gracilis ATCC 19624 TaxID=887062 RepID=F3KR29_9BURK|nr:acyl-CoA dehydrogenase family protein [Hylemonella gracilis]EGI77730.1 putative FMNH2-dependent monooxygenase [Hylemonella gracilis ATCC 19624]